MKTREKQLAIGAGLLIGGFVVFSVYTYVAGMFTEQQQRIAGLNKQIVDKEAKVKLGEIAAAQKLPTGTNARSQPIPNWPVRFIKIGSPGWLPR